MLRTLVVCIAPSLHLMTRGAKRRIERATYGLNTWYVLRLTLDISLMKIRYAMNSEWARMMYSVSFQGTGSAITKMKLFLLDETTTRKVTSCGGSR